jgi:hypothetical protein
MTLFYVASAAILFSRWKKGWCEKRLVVDEGLLGAAAVIDEVQNGE